MTTATTVSKRKRSQFPISPHVEGLIEPMCETTALLLRKVDGVEQQDYVLVSLEEDVYYEHDGQSVTVSTRRFRIECKSSDVNLRASYILRSDWWRHIPGSQQLHHSYGFTAPPTDVTALCVIAAVGRGKIDFEDEQAQMEFEHLVLRFVKQVRVSRAQAGYRQFKSVPNDAPGAGRHHPPMPHQATAAWCAARSEAYALFMEQSTGKTYTAILAVEENKRRCDDLFKAGVRQHACQMVLIECPKNVRTQWSLELHEFSKLRVATFKFVGGRVERSRVLLEAFKAKISGDFDVVYVIGSYKTIANSITQVCAYPWDFAIVDESHYIKWHATERTRATLKIRDKAERRICMTGTPIANYLFDLYSQLEFLGRGWSGFTSFEQFRKFYGAWKPQGRGVERLIALQNLPLIQERLARCAFLVKKAEVMPDLPAKTYGVIDVDMTEEQQAVYEALASQLQAEIERDIANAEASGKTVTVNNILTKLLRLAQVTSGFVPLDGVLDEETDTVMPRVIEYFTPNNKLDTMMEELKAHLEENPRSKVIIWSCFIPSITAIRKRLEAEGIKHVHYYGATKDKDRSEFELAWNTDPDLRVFVGNPGAGGVGLNLQGYVEVGDEYTVCDTIYVFDQDWSAIKRSQGEERPRGYVHESKTKTGKRVTWSVHIVDFCVSDSIDMQIRQRVTDKRISAAKIQDVREILRSLVCPIQKSE